MFEIFTDSGIMLVMLLFIAFIVVFVFLRNFKPSDDSCIMDYDYDSKYQYNLKVPSEQKAQETLVTQQETPVSDAIATAAPLATFIPTPPGTPGK